MEKSDRVIWIMSRRNCPKMHIYQEMSSNEKLHTVNAKPLTISREAENSGSYIAVKIINPHDDMKTSYIWASHILINTLRPGANREWKGEVGGAGILSQCTAQSISLRKGNMDRRASKGWWGSIHAVSVPLFWAAFTEDREIGDCKCQSSQRVDRTDHIKRSEIWSRQLGEWNHAEGWCNKEHDIICVSDWCHHEAYSAYWLWGQRECTVALLGICNGIIRWGFQADVPCYIIQHKRTEQMIENAWLGGC